VNLRFTFSALDTWLWPLGWLSAAKPFSFSLLPQTTDERLDALRSGRCVVHVEGQLGYSSQIKSVSQQRSDVRCGPSKSVEATGRRFVVTQNADENLGVSQVRRHFHPGKRQEAVDARVAYFL